MNECPENSVDEASQLYHNGRALMQSGDFQGALARLQGSVLINPHAKTLQLLGDCLLMLGRPMDAIIPLAASKGLNRQPVAPMRLAEAFLAIGDVVSAKALAEEAVAILPHHGPAHDVLNRAIEAHRKEFPELYDDEGARE